MDSLELRERIAKWENLHTEFKDWPLNPDQAAATLVAMANTDGGQFILGVANDRTIRGVPDADRATQWVDGIAYNNCEPPLTVVQEVLQEDEGTVVVVNVPKGDQRPYRTRTGQYYVRTSSGKRTASREELLRLFQASRSLFYDETPLPRLGVSDLSLDVVEKFAVDTGRVITDVGIEQLLRAWRFIHDGNPTVAGLLLFGHRPQEQLPFAQVNAARIPGTDIANEPFDRQDIGGRLLEMIDEVSNYLARSLTVTHEIRGFAPEQRPELPIEAFREAIVNALVHRDYTIPAPVRLLIFDDRVEIRSPGRTPNTIDEEAMRVGAHVVRNPHLYARVADAGLITGIGSGVPRMVRLVLEKTGMDVGIQIRESEVVVTLPRRNRGSLQSEAPAK